MQHIDYSKLKQQAKQASGSSSEQVSAAVQSVVGDIKTDGAEVKEVKLPAIKQEEHSESPQPVQEVQKTEEQVEQSPVEEKKPEPVKKTVDPMTQNDYDIFEANSGIKQVSPEIKKVRPGEYRDHIPSEVKRQDSDTYDEPETDESDTEEKQGKLSPKYRQVPRNSDGSTPVSTVKNIPTDLLNYVKSQFRYAAPNNTIAVAACLYAAVGFPQTVDVSDEIKQYANDFISDAVVIEDIRELMLARFSKIDMTLRDALRKMNDLEVGIVYSIFEKLGFKTEAAALTPSEVDFLEIGTGDLRRQLEKQSHGQWERDIQNKGRPIK